MALPCDKADMALFRASTDITLGDGARCLFWHDRWTPGGALKLQFPELYAIVTRKFRTVQKELLASNWMKALFRISTHAQLLQFISLWGIMQGVALLP